MCTNQPLVGFCKGNLVSGKMVFTDCLLKILQILVAERLPGSAWLLFSAQTCCVFLVRVSASSTDLVVSEQGIRNLPPTPISSQMRVEVGNGNAGR